MIKTHTHTQTQKKSKYKHNLTNTKGSQSDAKLFKSEKQKKALANGIIILDEADIFWRCVKF